MLMTRPSHWSDRVDHQLAPDSRVLITILLTSWIYTLFLFPSRSGRSTERQKRSERSRERWEGGVSEYILFIHWSRWHGDHIYLISKLVCITRRRWLCNIIILTTKERRWAAAADDDWPMKFYYIQANWKEIIARVSERLCGYQKIKRQRFVLISDELQLRVKFIRRKIYTFQLHIRIKVDNLNGNGPFEICPISDLKFLC